MSHARPSTSVGETHDVINQSPPFTDVNLYTSDRALRSAVTRDGGDWALGALETYGGLMGSARVYELGRQANRFSPELRTHDRFGHRIDEVDYHPAWHEVMRIQMEHEVHNLPWRHRRPGAARRAAGLGRRRNLLRRPPAPALRRCGAGPGHRQAAAGLGCTPRRRTERMVAVSRGNAACLCVTRAPVPSLHNSRGDCP